MADTLTLETLAAEVRTLAANVGEIAHQMRRDKPDGMVLEEVANDAGTIHDRLSAALEQTAADALTAEAQARGEYDELDEELARVKAGVMAKLEERGHFAKAEDADVAAVRDEVKLLRLRAFSYGAANASTAVHVREVEHRAQQTDHSERAILAALSRLATRLREAERERESLRAQIAETADAYAEELRRSRDLAREVEELEAKLDFQLTKREELRARVAPLIERAKAALHGATLPAVVPIGSGHSYAEFVQQLDRADIVRDLARLALDAETT